MKILVRMPNWLGDAVLALPALRAVAANFPQAELWVAASTRTAELLAEEKEIKGVMEVPEVMNLKDMWRVARKWRQMRFDLTILLTNSFGSAALSFLARIPDRWGYASDGRGFLLTRKVRSRTEEHWDNAQEKGNGEKGKATNGTLFSQEEIVGHQAYYYLRLLKELNLQIPEEPEITIEVTAAEQEEARRMLQAGGVDVDELKKNRWPLVLLNPGAAYGAAKCWPPERFGEVAAILEHRRKAAWAVVGSSAEVALAEWVIKAAQQRGAQGPSLMLAGKTTLRELLGLMSLADLFISNDSGTMHLANALRLPVVAIFGPTDPRVTRPFHQPYAVFHKRVVCWPCYYRQCPYDHRCMKAISPEEVVEACLALLNQTKDKK